MREGDKGRPSPEAVGLRAARKGLRVSLLLSGRTSWVPEVMLPEVCGHSWGQARTSMCPGCWGLSPTCLESAPRQRGSLKILHSFYTYNGYKGVHVLAR